MIKAIETNYDGYKFRSRIEARWAVFFNELKIPYDYEREGYDMNGVWYLPDFWIQQWNSFVEIKGGEPTDEEISKCSELNKISGHRVFIFHGICSAESHKVKCFCNNEDDIKDFVDSFSGFQLRQCRRCDEICIGETDDDFAWFSLGEHSLSSKRNCGDRPALIHNNIKKAFGIAKAYRFENF